jgi:hypothetical protein
MWDKDSKKGKKKRGGGEFIGTRLAAKQKLFGMKYFWGKKK